MKIIIAGGGTGGHLFPGIAVAEEFLKRDKSNSVLFIGTEKGIEKRILGNLGFHLSTIDVEGIKGKGLWSKCNSLFKIPSSLLQSYRIIQDFCPNLVIGVGGYASGPAVITARFMGIKTAIMEQNALPGITNRILGHFVDRIFLTFPDTEGWFPKKKASVYGNPVRSAFLSETQNKKISEGRFTILIFGGSQGAHAINTAALNALPYLKETPQLKIIHQTGAKDFENVATVYGQNGINADVLPFITDMAAAYRSADLLICRAGATSLAEITASGKAAILIPFPFAVNDHQTKNAEVLVQAKAAVMIHEKDLNGKKLAEVIESLLHHPQRIRDMEGNSLKIGNVRAAQDIVDDFMKMAQ